MITFKQFLKETWEKDNKTKAAAVWKRFMRKRGAADDTDLEDGFTPNPFSRTDEKVSFKQGINKGRFSDGELHGSLKMFERPPYSSVVYDMFEKYAKPDHIPIEYIHSNQDTVSGPVVHGKLTGRISKKKYFPQYPYVLKLSPTLYHLVDGNHQVIAARLKNPRGLLYCYVLDADILQGKIG